MKKIITSIGLLSMSISFSQQIGDGLAAPYLTDFSGFLKSGVYGGFGTTLSKVPDNSADWNHLFVIRHANTANNHQLQIASSFAENDRLFFRKIAGNLSRIDPSWVELATRGNNNFIGNQIINGKVGIGINPSANLEVLTPVETKGVYDSQKWNSGNLGFNLRLQTIWTDNGIWYEFIQRYNSKDYKSIVFYNGNVGIDTSTPDAKLSVNGTIHSKEVKVDMSGWPDFVFKETYTLPTLGEVENHIKDKGHLENIPSEKEVLKNGINLGEMNAKLLQKIEELTLYLIEQNKSIENLVKENKFQNDEILNLKRKLLSN